jgi:hypothetical protein
MLLFVTRGKVLKNGLSIVNSIKRLFENNYGGKIKEGHGKINFRCLSLPESSRFRLIKMGCKATHFFDG